MRFKVCYITSTCKNCAILLLGKFVSSDVLVKCNKLFINKTVYIILDNSILEVAIIECVLYNNEKNLQAKYGRK